jgi:hypothetical protein
LKTRLVLLVKSWWFLGMFLLFQIIPPYTSTSYPLMDWGKVKAYILMHHIKSVLNGFFPYFKILPLVVILYLVLRGKWAARIFNGYIAMMLLIFSVIQSVSISETYGFSICLANVFTFVALAIMWIWPAQINQMDDSHLTFSAWKWVLLGLAILPFWEPVNVSTLTPDINPVLLLTSGAGLSFCMLMPLFLSICILYFPRINRMAFLSTSFIGFWMGLGNFLLEFILYPQYGWIGVLHVPLVVISFCGLVLEFKSTHLTRGVYVG